MIQADLIKISFLTCLSFVIALAATPFFISVLNKKKLGKNIRNNGDTPYYSNLHSNKAGTPTMGGVLVWGTLALLALALPLLARFFHSEFLKSLTFLSRRETYLPFGAILGASIVGLFDDWLDIKRKGHNGKGLRFRTKIWLYLLVAIIGAWWFYYKLGFSQVYVPFHGLVDFKWLFIPFFIFTVIATSFAVNQTDGLDGLAGGCMLMALFAFEIIAYSQGRINLAAFIGIIIGSLLAFLWFNVHPALFFMGDTGSMGLGVLLAIVAFLTHSVFILPIVGFVFVLEAASTVIQLVSKKIFKKKVFLSSPIHHHLEVLGWPEAKITMRFWIISAVMAIIGLIIYFIG